MKLHAILCSLLLSLPALAADITGAWSASATDPDGQIIRSQMIVQQDAGAYKGEVRVRERTIPMRDVQFQNDELQFKLPWGETLLTIRMKLAGEELKGTFTDLEGNTGPVTARRAPAPAATGPAGKWKVIAITGSGREMKLELELKQDGAAWAGTLVTEDGNAVPLADVAVDDASVAFKIPTDQGTYIIKLARDGNALKGTYASPNGTTGPITAAR